MSDKLTTEEENGEKVFTVELEPGSEVTMQTADTYVDKNIRVKAKSVEPITYTGGTGIDVDNDNYTISVDDTVVTVSKLASGELQAIDLDPKSSHVISQVVTAIDGFIGPAVVLYTTDPETGALNPTQYGTLGVQTDGLEHPIVGLTADTEDAKLVLGSYQERPQYYNLTDSNFYDISLVGDVGKLIQNDEGKWEPFTEQIYTKEFAVGQNTNTGYYTSLTTSELMMQDENIIQMFTRYAVPNWDDLSSVEQEQYAQDFGVYFGSENYPLYLMGKGGRPIYADGEDVHELAYITDFTGTAVDGKWTSLTINGTTASIGGGSESSYGDAEVKTLLSGQTVQSIDLDPSSSHVNAQLVAASDLMMSQSYALYTTDEQGKFQSNASGGLYVEDDTDYKMVAVVAEKENLNVVLASHNQRPYYIDLSKDEDPHGQEGIALLSDLIAGEGTITLTPAQLISQDPITFQATEDQLAIFNDAYKMTLYVDADALGVGRFTLMRQYDESANQIKYYSTTPYQEQRGEVHQILGTQHIALIYNKGGDTFQVAMHTQENVSGSVDAGGKWTSLTIGEMTGTFSTDKDLTRAEIITALGYTPYDSANPSNYITSAGVSYTTVTNALGFVPYSATNPDGYITGITNDMVVNALGYSPYDSSNPNGYITGISKNDVTTALGYTPYSSANPNGFITRTVSNLENYFDKATISEMIGQGLQTKIVATLPTSDIKTNIIYMVPLTGTEGYTQWMFIDGNWEKLGTTNINLTEYAKTADLSDVAKTGSYTSLLDKPDIPTDLGDLTNTAGYIKNDVSNLTNYTKTADLATVARTGAYSDLSGKPTIPTSVGSLANDAGYLTAGDLTSIGVSTFPNDANYAKMSDITALQELDVEQIKEAIAITQNVGTIKGVTAGTGLSGGGETGKVTLNHSNSVTAKTTYGSNETSVVSGGSFTVTDVKYDSEGHITASRDRQITIPVIPDITGMLTENNYGDTLDSVYQEKGNYQPAGTYLTPVNVVNDNTGNYVANVTQTTNGQITVTKGSLPTLSVIEGSTTTPTTDSVTVLKSVAGSGHAITETFVNVPTQKYIDDLVGDINAVLDAINGEVI